MKPVHPGRLLRREMQARDLSANALALALAGQLRPHHRDPERKARRVPGDGDAAGALFRQQCALLAQFADDIRTGDRGGGAWRTDRRRGRARDRMRSAGGARIDPGRRATAASVAADAPPAIAPAGLAAAAAPAVAPAAPPPDVLDIAVEARNHAVMGRDRHGLGGRRNRGENERRRTRRRQRLSASRDPHFWRPRKGSPE